ncbi:MAG: hypothetical protein M1827_004185 [Pycnora praestabilis]|nr:MAG: hypothetical protein M1827_004185 [Pycnora praestabilis]
MTSKPPFINIDTPIPIQRASAISSHLVSCIGSTSQTADQAGGSMEQKAPITCHVLDTTTGRPAASLDVSLTLLQPLGPAAPMTATTNLDGRVTTWQSLPGPTLHEIFSSVSPDNGGGQMVWSLKFETGKYFGEGKTFFPEVEIKFYVTGRQEHYHVPLLLGPWNYTTYRGS